MHGSNALLVAKPRKHFEIFPVKYANELLQAAVMYLKELGLHSPWSEVSCIASEVGNAFSQSIYSAPGAWDSNVLKNAKGQIQGKPVITIIVKR